VGRVSQLERFLKALDAQTYRGYELIVVDQNNDSRLSSLLLLYQKNFSILHLRSELGLSRARNVGLRHVSGDVVAFPDDDCWYPPDLLERVAAFLDDHPELSGVTVRQGGSNKQTGAARFDEEAGLLTLANVWRRAVSSAMFFRRSVVETVGAFDETLGVGAGTLWEGGEDIDYPLRAVESGYNIYYRPDIHVFHPEPPGHDYSQLADRAYRYGAGIGRVWRKHDYPLWLVAYYLLRPIGGAILSVTMGHKGKARYHVSAFRGRLRGWLANSE
jgi:GT2 family glycosyltransferase